MKKKPNEWLAEIHASHHSKGTDSWYAASCPICGASQNATVLSSASAAEIAARGKILTHIRMSHAEHVDQSDEKT